jgi:hypothetical protein
MFKEIFDFLNKYNGYSAASAAKKKHGEDTSKMTYGEFDSVSCNDMITTLKKYKKLDGTESVIDLGSGMGKLVVALHYSGLFSNVYGVELLTGLYEDSLKLIEDYAKEFGRDVSNISIFNDDMLNLSYSPYNVIISNTSINDELLANIIKKINLEAEKDTIAISTINRFIDTNLDVVESYSTSFSWGSSHLNFSIKK